MTYFNNITYRYNICFANSSGTQFPLTNINESKPETKPSPEPKLTPAFIHKLLNGDLTENSVTINGVTHYKYEDCKSGNLVTTKNGIQIEKNTALAFKEMQEYAAEDGINLTLVSGFRSKEYQKNVFRKRGTSAEIIKNRVKASAVPGFSEHHTGHAIDMNSVDPKDFREGGKYYNEYKWLTSEYIDKKTGKPETYTTTDPQTGKQITKNKTNAEHFGFEQSFPSKNAQGVMEEAWHWRFVGKNGEFKDLFKEARMNDPRYSQEYK